MFRKLALNFLNFSGKTGSRAISQRGFNFKKVSAIVLPTVSLGFLINLKSKSVFATNEQESEFFEVIIDANLAPGEMREVQVGPKQEDVVLVANVDGKYYCTQSTCPHFGLPLTKGTLFDDKVSCPFHSASFSVITGYPEDGPTFDGLARYEIHHENGKLHIKVPKAQLNKKVTMTMSKRGNDPRRFIIVGGGAAGMSAAETLRQGGFEGEILMFSDEEVVPYDRTLLSKWIFGNNIDFIKIRDKQFLDQYDITLINKAVIDIDFEKNELQAKDSSRFKYDKILLSTGGTPRRPPIKGTDLQNVHVLRNYKDLQNIQKSSAEGVKDILVVGASFIGLETANTLKKGLKDVNVTVVDITNFPLERVFGTKIGEHVKAIHEENGIKFFLKTGLKSLNGSQKIESVTLSNGETVKADLVILGTGISPNNSLAAQGKIKLSENGGIETNEFLRTSKENVYAAGDIASYPYPPLENKSVRIEHYAEAITQGSVAALNMLGENVKFTGIPFFWTRMWDKTFQYTGYADSYDEIHIDGEVGKSYVAYYIKGNKVLAAAAFNRIPHLMVIREALSLGVMPSAEEIKSGKVSLDEIKKRLNEKRPASRCRKANCCKNRKK